MTRRTLMRVLAALALSALSAAGCQRSSHTVLPAQAAPATGSTGPVQLSGMVFAGPVAGGTVQAFTVTAGGVGATPLGFGATDATGRFSFGITTGGTLAGVYLMCASGSYAEESDGREVALSAATALSVAVPTVSGSVSGLAITPLSTLAAARGLYVVSQGTHTVAEALNNANLQIAAAFGLADVTRATLVDVTANAAAGSAITDAGVQYALVLAGWSVQAQGFGADSPALMVALADDVRTDGAFDGQGAAGAITVGSGTLSATTTGADLAAGIDAFAGGSRNRSGISATATDALEAAVTAGPATLPVAPAVTAVSPATGAAGGGETVTISGSGFTSASAVRFGAQSAAVTARALSASPQTLTVTTPAATPATVDVTVVEGSLTGTRGQAYTFQATGAAAFTFRANTDRWFVNVAADEDASGTADLAEALALAKTSNGGIGGFAGKSDEAAAFLLSFCAQYYHNNPDGSAAAGGIPVSVQSTPPTSGTTPAAADVASATGTSQYNTMAIRNVAFLGNNIEKNGTVGLALAESNENRFIENDSGLTSDQQPLGVRIDAELHFWNVSGAWSTSQRTLEEWMRHVGSTLAHEIGHSIGHGAHYTTAPPAPANTNIMSAISTAGPNVIYDWDTVRYAAMAGWMPGPNRCQHRVAWAPRLLVAGAQAVLRAQPERLADGRLTFAVREVLAGDPSAGSGQAPAGATFTLAGFDPRRRVSEDTFAAGGEFLLFVARDARGVWTFPAGEGGAVPLAGRDLEEWRALIADYRALAALAARDPTAHRAAYAARLARSLRATDAGVRDDALLELSVAEDVVRACDAAALQPVAELLIDPAVPAPTRALAAQVALHRADPRWTGALVAAALGSSDAEVQRCAAGALEMTLGLAEAAAEVRDALAREGDDAVRARGAAVLGWLCDRESLPLVLAELGRAEPARCRAAAAALAHIGGDEARAALQRVVLDPARDDLTHAHALRALGRRDDPAARAWLDGEWARTPDGPRREQLRYARDWARCWLLPE